jgi:hypothetical protein
VGAFVRKPKTVHRILFPNDTPPAASGLAPEPGWQAIERRQGVRSGKWWLVTQPEQGHPISTELCGWTDESGVPA